MVIPGFSNYDITEDGVVTCLSTGKQLNCHIVQAEDYYKYKRAILVSDDGRRCDCNIVRLLALTYLKKPDGPCMAKAKDGDNLNAVLSNVEWVPYNENVRKAWESGKMTNRRSRQKCWTEEFLELLYDTLLLYEEPVRATELSDALDVSYTVVRYALMALIQRGKAKKLVKGFVAL